VSPPLYLSAQNNADLQASWDAALQQGAQHYPKTALAKTLAQRPDIAAQVAQIRDGYFALFNRKMRVYHALLRAPEQTLMVAHDANINYDMILHNYESFRALKNLPNIDAHTARMTLKQVIGHATDAFNDVFKAFLDMPVSVPQVAFSRTPEEAGRRKEANATGGKSWQDAVRSIKGGVIDVSGAR
jgi:hypothetical protein